jgi:hypothetical protein
LPKTYSTNLSFVRENEKYNLLCLGGEKWEEFVSAANENVHLRLQEGVGIWRNGAGLSYLIWLDLDMKF